MHLTFGGGLLQRHYTITAYDVRELLPEVGRIYCNCTQVELFKVILSIWLKYYSSRLLRNCFFLKSDLFIFRNDVIRQTKI